MLLPKLETEPPLVMKSAPLPLYPRSRLPESWNELPEPLTVTIPKLPVLLPMEPELLETAPPLVMASVPVSTPVWPTTMLDEGWLITPPLTWSVPLWIIVPSV